MTRIRLSLIIIAMLFQSLQAESPGFMSYNTKGFDLELLSYGGSFGGFYSFHPSEALTLDVETDWSIVESNNTFSFYDYYSQPRTINNQNLSFVKLLVGSTWFPFLDSMHPSLQLGPFVAAGPLFALNTDDREKFTERWQDVKTTLTPIYRGGLHIKILTGQGSSYNFRLGYDYAKFANEVDSKQVYNGLFFQVGMEFLSR